ncbi:MAG TPA: cytochrome c oxidase subunit I [Opitutaceae bacterium]|jgi:cytochrome c oxidase subunit 1/cytochrome c oxidase subunit I+III
MSTGSRRAWLMTVDHKRIGILYILTALVFFLVGGLEALALRIQLVKPGNHFLSPQAFNELFTMHGTTMIFLVAMPALIGFGNYLLPLMIGARDMAFPRLNALGYWMLPCGGFLLYFSFLAGGAPSVGWFSYAPLSEAAYSSNTGVDYWTIAILLLGAGSVAGAVNLITTTLTLRAPGMTLRQVPLFVWMMFITSILIILAIPALNADVVLLMLDRLLRAHFFVATGGGSALLWQHFFWAFGHPEVYILALPAFGMISEVIPVFARKPIFGYEFVAASTVAIALLSLGVWAHHMFAVGLGRPSDLFFAASSFLIAVPTGVKIFNWTATLWGGSIRLRTPLLFAVAFLIQFTVGGLSGITFAMVPMDWQLTDTYYLVAHMHYVMFGGTLFGLFAGVYYWFPKMTGRKLNEGAGRWHFWLTVIGFNLTFFVQHFLGLMGMPRRVYTYPDLPYWGAFNAISTVGAFILGLSVVVLLVNIWVSLRRGEIAGDNPWDAWTLEWATTSPPPEHNFRAVPPVRSRRPLWDLAHPQNCDPVLSPAVTVAPRIKPPALTGTATFIVSEAMFFLMLLIAFVFYNVSSHGGQYAATALNAGRSAIFTIALLASSGTLWLGERALDRGRQGAFRLWIAVTLALGVVFLVGQGGEYLDLLHKGVVINSSLFASTFFTVTGFHGLHVAVGLIALLVLAIQAWAGDFRKGRTDGVHAVSLYWHFVDAVWIAVFILIYLIGPHL